MTIPNMQDVNDDARVLRTGIDGMWEMVADTYDAAEANEQTLPLYNAVTRLHELAASAVRANDAKGIGRS